MLLPTLLFFAALLQDFLVTTWNRAVVRKAVLTATCLSFVTTVLPLTAYGHILSSAEIVSSILAYGAGSAAGTFLSLRYETQVLYIQERIRLRLRRSSS